MDGEEKAQAEHQREEGETPPPRELRAGFVGGKQKRVRRPPTIDGLDLEAFIAQNADPIWLHQNELWEDIPSEE
jgi:hypothetical protein